VLLHIHHPHPETHGSGSIGKIRGQNHRTLARREGLNGSRSDPSGWVRWLALKSSLKSFPRSFQPRPDELRGTNTTSAIPGPLTDRRRPAGSRADLFISAGGIGLME